MSGLDMSVALDGVKAKAMAALMNAGEFLLQQANETIPFDTGDMARSGKVTADPANNRVVVSYDTPYAPAQHEDTRIEHRNGRRAKWLQKTLTEQADKITTIIRQGVAE